MLPEVKEWLDFAKNIRYPGEWHITEQQTAKALKCAQELLDWAVSEIGK